MDQRNHEQDPEVALLNLSDECAEFRDICAFFCDATAALFAHSSNADRRVREGLVVISQQVKRRACELHDELGRVRSVMAGRRQPTEY